MSAPRGFIAGHCLLIIGDRPRLRRIGVILLSVLASGHLVFTLLPDVFGAWNARTVDRLFVFRSSSPFFRTQTDPRVVNVNLDDTTLDLFSRSALDRSHFARVVANLRAVDIAVQAYDFIFAAPAEPAADQSFVDAVTRAGNAYFGLALYVEPSVAARERPLDFALWSPEVVGEDPGPKRIPALVTFPALSSAAAGIGFLNATPDDDGVFRRIPLLLPVRGGYAPSLGLAAACRYLGVQPADVVLNPGRSITLRNARRLAGAAPRDIVIPIDRDGNLILNFSGPWESLNHFAFETLWEASDDRDRVDILRDQLGGRIVVVAETSTGIGDVGPVPTDALFPLAGLHATVLHGILSEAFLREAPWWLTGSIDAVLTALLFALAARWTAARFLLATALSVLVYVAVWAAAFLWQGLILEIVRPVLYLCISAAAITAYQQFVDARERALLRHSFEAYFSPLWVERLVREPATIIDAVQKKELTILFSDIKDFTSRSAAMEPEDVRELLNEYFAAMVDVVFRHGGTVDKFIGDGLMAFFGDPEPQEDHADRAIACAMEMQRTMRPLNASFARQQRAPIEIRIGISTGVVVVGNMGSSQRLSYTALGADVNLAQRLEANARVGSILMSERTHASLWLSVPKTARAELSLKGLPGPITAYEIPPEGMD